VRRPPVGRFAALCRIGNPPQPGTAAQTLHSRRRPGTRAAFYGSVIRSARKHCHDLLAGRAGRRFQHFHNAHKAKRVGWARCLTWLAILVSLIVGVVLVFIPGPAVVFFAFAAALTSTQSLSLARKLDRSELYTRAVWRKHQRRRRERHAQRARQASTQRPATPTRSATGPSAST
jgi:hypothetical protein